MAKPRQRTRHLPTFGRRRLASAGAVVVLVSTMIGVSAPRQPATAVADLLPDLRAAPLTDWRITTSGGRRLLRFTAMMVNTGKGHFELRGYRDGPSDPTMSINQVIYNDAGGSRQVATTAEGRYAGDGHDHWHVQRMMSYSMWPVSGPVSVVRGSKVGFCFLDTDPWNLGLPGARSFSYYRGSWCGSQAVLSNRVGISVGWGDKYRWDIAFQWIDITGVPAGEYYVRTVVDEPNSFRELNNGNNCGWSRIRIPSSGSTVQVLGSGSTCLAPPSATAFPGVITYANGRRVSLAAGEHVGYRFAANGTVIASLPTTLPQASGATASRASTIPGLSGSWFYITNGIWAGYWMRESAAVVGAALPVPHVAFPGTSAVPAPSRVALAAGAHYGYTFTSDGATIASKWYPLGSASGANVDRRGTIPGHPGTWVHVTNGIWAGYWIKESGGAVFDP